MASELERALRTVLREPVDLTVAGRTDRGVHALGQVVSYPGPLPPLRSVNALLPGIVETDIVRATGPDSAVAMGVGTYDKLIEMFTEESAIKRPNTAEEVAAVAVLLASDAARNMTGCLFPIDGGTLPY